MSEHVGEKTEQPTARRLEEALQKGQFPRSAEVQTIFVLAGGFLALMLAGGEIWRHLALSMTGILGHLHEISLSATALPEYLITGVLLFAKTVWPVVLAALLAGLLGGGIQSRFRSASEAMTPDWARVNPLAGLKRLFSMRSAAPTGIAVLKLAAIVGLTYGTVVSVMNDPIFSTAISTVRIAQFLSETSFSIVMRIAGVLLVIAAMDYGYQFWRTQQDLMMTRDEVKDELKNTEGNPQVKTQQRRRRLRRTQRKMLLEVPKADVVITNPTHLAIALRYDRKSMRAPRIIAKGSRLNALRIREIAARHQVPIVENKPLARMMFKYGKVGGEIPVQFYTAVAEILAWVYRVNRYRYYTEENQTTS